MDLLQVKVEDCTDSPMMWMEPLAVRLAGEMRLEQAISPIINKLGMDDDYLHQECQRALIRIGTDEVVQTLAERFRSADDIQITVCHILELIHSDLSVAKCLELVEHTDDTTVIQACLLSAALLNFTADAIEPARQFVLNTPLDPDVIDVRSNLLIASNVLVIEFPEQAEWREALKGDQEFRRKWYAEHYGRLDATDDYDDDDDFDDVPLEPSMTIHKGEPKIGRNDPCPCGSGKKYKRCCLKKLKENPLWN